MSIVHAVVLGITQGLSEFLPISSSGHLDLVPWLFGWDDLAGQPHLDKAFDVALHLGTFVGAAAYFREELVRYAVAAMRVLRRPGRGGAPGADPDARMGGWLLVSAVPAAVVGATLESVIEEHTSAVGLIAVMLIAFGLVLLVADRLAGARPFGSFRARDAVLMGTAQALALQPGVSRSGITISAARALGFDRDAAARLSFLMSLPIIFGAGVFEAADVAAAGGIPSHFVGPFVWGSVASAVTGFLAVGIVLRIVRTRSFAPFVVYRVLLGVGVLAVLATSWR